MARQVMVDIESLGTASGSAILSIGACVFERDNEGEGPFKYYRNIDLLDAIFAGLTIDHDTVRWWAKQPSEVIRTLTQKPVSLKEALDAFANFLHKDDRVWARGPDFDLVLLKAAYDKVGIQVPWSFRLSRDVRTILALAESAGQKKPYPSTFEGFIEHFALHDAKLQMMQVQNAARFLGLDLGGEEREGDEEREDWIEREELNAKVGGKKCWDKAEMEQISQRTPEVGKWLPTTRR